MNTLSFIAHRPARSAVLLLVLPFLAACAGASRSGEVEPADAEPGQLIAYGAQVYGVSCARCHNARAAAERSDRDWGVVVSHMRARANLTGTQARAVRAFLTMVNAPSGDQQDDAAAPQLPEAALGPTEAPEEGVRTLVPPWARTGSGPMADEDIAGAVAPGVPETPQDQSAFIKRGRELITAKGCIGCHTVEGKGGIVGPKLDDVFERRDAEYVQKKLTNPAFDNPNSVMPNLGLTEDDVKALLTYLQSLQKGG